MRESLDRLRELLPSPGMPGPSAERARDADADDPGRPLAALLALAVATLLWFTFSMRETYTVAVEVPLVVSQLPADRALRERPPATATLQMRGEGWSLLTISRTPPPVELRAGEEALSIVQAATESSRLPAGVSVLGAQPATVKLALEEAVARVVPVRLTGTIGVQPPYGLLRSPILRPDSVRVTGARSLLAGLDSWPTDPLQLGTLRRTRVVTVTLRDTLDGLVNRSVDRATVTFEVEQFTEGERMLEVRVRNVPPDVTAVRLLPARVRAIYLVPVAADYYERARESDAFYAEVDYNEIARDTSLGTVSVRARVPAGLPLRQIRLSPDRLEYFTVRD
jgi:hypothetical protein